MREAVHNVLTVECGAAGVLVVARFCLKRGRTFFSYEVEQTVVWGLGLAAETVEVGQTLWNSAAGAFACLWCYGAIAEPGI